MLRSKMLRSKMLRSKMLRSKMLRSRMLRSRMLRSKMLPTGTTEPVRARAHVHRVPASGAVHRPGPDYLVSV
jgi:hypothetical protein